MNAEPRAEMGPDTQSFLGELYRREYARLRQTAYAAAEGSAHKVDPSGAAVEALIKAALNRDQFRGGTEAEFRAWLRQILVNQVREALRRLETRTRSAPAGSPALDRTETAPGPAAAAERADDVAALNRAIDRLSDDDREVLLLAHRSDLPQTVIAEVLGLSAPAVRQRVTRARARLRDELQRNE